MSCNLKLLIIAVLYIMPMAVFSQSYDDRLEELNIKLPETGAPLANYVKWKKIGNLIYLSGHVSTTKGKLGEDLSTEQGYEAAREAAIAILATLKGALGTLDSIDQIVSANGMVNSTPEFYDQSKVINGFSDLMVSIFGEKGKHTRTAVGQTALPGNYAVEIAVIIATKEKELVN